MLCSRQSPTRQATRPFPLIGKKGDTITPLLPSDTQDIFGAHLRNTKRLWILKSGKRENDTGHAPETMRSSLHARHDTHARWPESFCTTSWSARRHTSTVPSHEPVTMTSPKGRVRWTKAMHSTAHEWAWSSRAWKRARVQFDSLRTARDEICSFGVTSELTHCQGADALRHAGRMAGVGSEQSVHASPAPSLKLGESASEASGRNLNLLWSSRHHRLLLRLCALLLCGCRHSSLRLAPRGRRCRRLQEGQRRQGRQPDAVRVEGSDVLRPEGVLGSRLAPPAADAARRGKGLGRKEAKHMQKHLGWQLAE